MSLRSSYYFLCLGWFSSNPLKVLCWQFWHSLFKNTFKVSYLFSSHWNNVVQNWHLVLLALGLLGCDNVHTLWRFTLPAYYAYIVFKDIFEYLIISILNVNVELESLHTWQFFEKKKKILHFYHIHRVIRHCGWKSFDWMLIHMSYLVWSSTHSRENVVHKRRGTFIVLWEINKKRHK